MAKSSSMPIQQLRLYEIVAEKILKEHVLKMKAGDRLPTEVEFAEVFQVSVPTVREALRSLVQSGYLRRRQGSGTYRADEKSGPAAKQESARCVAIVTPLDLADGSLSCFYPQTALLTAKELGAIGIRSEIYFGETAPATPRSFDEAPLLRDIKAGRISAAVVISENDLEQHRYAKALRAAGIPIINADFVQAPSGASRALDFIERAVNILIGHKRRKMACIGFGGMDVAQIRDMINSRGGITDDAWMIGDLHPNEVGSGYSLMREVWMTSKIKPDGLILFDDVFFQDAALAIRELGIKVPDQLLLVSSKNRGVRLVAPFPTIEIQYDAAGIASQIAKNVASVLSGKGESPLVATPLVSDPLSDSDLGESRADEPERADSIRIS